MVPLLADYVLFRYDWQHVCGLFSFFCFLSTLFGLFLEPPKFLENLFELNEGSCSMTTETGQQLGFEYENEVKSLVIEGLEDHTNIFKLKNMESSLLTSQAKNCPNLDKNRRHSIINSNLKDKQLKKNKSESCLYAIEHCVTPYKKLKKIVEQDLESSNKGKIETINFSVVSCIDILLNLEQKEKMLMDGIISEKKSCFSLENQDVDSSAKQDNSHPGYCVDLSKKQSLSKNVDEVEKEQ